MCGAELTALEDGVFGERRMSNDAILETHHLSVSQEQFFRFLKEACTTTTSFLGELLQNARRAGATHIYIVWDPDEAVMTVTDDGCGIGDFSKVFRAGESGWDEKIIRC